MRAEVVALIALALTPALAVPLRAQMPEDIAPGVYAELEGIEGADATIVASEVELRHTPVASDQVQGTIASVDRARRRITVAGVPVLPTGDARLLGDDGDPVDFAAFEPGARIDARGRFQGGTLLASSLELRTGTDGAEREVGLEGRISRVDRASGTFQLLGATVRVTPDTSVELD